MNEYSPTFVLKNTAKEYEERARRRQMFCVRPSSVDSPPSSILFASEPAPPSIPDFHRVESPASSLYGRYISISDGGKEREREKGGGGGEGGDCFRAAPPPLPKYEGKSRHMCCPYSPDRDRETRLLARSLDLWDGTGREEGSGARREKYDTNEIFAMKIRIILSTGVFGDRSSCRASEHRRR